MKRDSLVGCFLLLSLQCGIPTSLITKGAVWMACFTWWPTVNSVGCMLCQPQPKVYGNERRFLSVCDWSLKRFGWEMWETLFGPGMKQSSCCLTVCWCCRRWRSDITGKAVCNLVQHAFRLELFKRQGSLHLVWFTPLSESVVTVHPSKSILGISTCLWRFLQGSMRRHRSENSATASPIGELACVYPDRPRRMAMLVPFCAFKALVWVCSFNSLSVSSCRRRKWWWRVWMSVACTRYLIDYVPCRRTHLWRIN